MRHRVVVEMEWESESPERDLVADQTIERVVKDIVSWLGDEGYADALAHGHTAAVAV